MGERDRWSYEDARRLVSGQAPEGYALIEQEPEESDGDRCLLCGERFDLNDERAEVVQQVPLGDDFVEERGVAHAQCYLDHKANDEAIWLA